jgi:hypothetical protein
VPVSLCTQPWFESKVDVEPVEKVRPDRQCCYNKVLDSESNWGGPLQAKIS